VSILGFWVSLAATDYKRVRQKLFLASFSLHGCLVPEATGELQAPSLVA
jgi:hypothetical protein